MTLENKIKNFNKYIQKIIFNILMINIFIAYIDR
jgi:hypothetical protein